MSSLRSRQAQLGSMDDSLIDIDHDLREAFYANAELLARKAKAGEDVRSKIVELCDSVPDRLRKDANMSIPIALLKKYGDYVPSHSASASHTSQSPVSTRLVHCSCVHSCKCSPSSSTGVTSTDFAYLGIFIIFIAVLVYLLHPQPTGPRPI